MTIRIIHYRNAVTGELAPAHILGQDDEGRTLYQGVSGYIPVDGRGNVIAVDSDHDGNWTVNVDETEEVARLVVERERVKRILDGARVRITRGNMAGTICTVTGRDPDNRTLFAVRDDDGLTMYVEPRNLEKL